MTDQTFPETADPTEIRGGTYGLDTMHSRVVFSVSHMGFSEWYGELSGLTGSLEIDPQAPEAATLAVTIPVSTLATTNVHVDSELRGEKWFDAARFPDIRFTSTAIRRTGEGAAEITGNLAFHGVVAPVSLSAVFNGAGTNPFTQAYTIGFSGQARFRRSDFGVGTLVPMIGDMVTLRISAEFAKI